MTQKAKEAEDVEAMSPEQMWRYVYKQDYGKSPEQSMEAINEEVIQPVLNHPATKVGKVLAVEMPLAPISPGDVLRLGFGVDPYTGEDLSWKERGKEAVSAGLMLGGGKALKAGNELVKIPVSDEIIDLADKVLNSFDSYNDVREGIETEFFE